MVSVDGGPNTECLLMCSLCCGIRLAPIFHFINPGPMQIKEHVVAVVVSGDEVRRDAYD